MSPEDVLYQVDGKIALVTLNRPKYRNAQSWPLLDALDEALDRAMRDEDVRVLLLQGAGNGRTALRISKLAINKAQDIQGYSAAMEAAFADYLVMAQGGDAAPREGERRLGAVDLALRGLRGERPGLERG
jgi:1,4-dihydroxy-2-naphthoyl-CoA synthase